MGGGRLNFTDSKATFPAGTLKHGVQLQHFFMDVCITPCPFSQHSWDMDHVQSIGHRVSAVGSFNHKGWASSFTPSQCGCGANDPGEGDTEQPTRADQTKTCFLFLPLGVI